MATANPLHHTSNVAIRNKPSDRVHSKTHLPTGARIPETIPSGLQRVAGLRRPELRATAAQPRATLRLPAMSRRVVSGPAMSGLRQPLGSASDTERVEFLGRINEFATGSVR